MGIGPVKKAIFLDRDGVLNDAVIKNGKPYPPQNLNELQIPDGVQVALNILKSEHFLLICVTNQPDVARGKTTYELVEAINAFVLTELSLDDIRVCYHDDDHHCVCRKPAPGLLLQAASDYDIDLSKSFMIGDRWRDIEAGINAGCKTIWINCGYQEQAPPRPANFTASSLSDAAEWICHVMPA